MTSEPVSYDDRRFWGEFIKLYRDLPVLWTKMDDAEDKQNKHLRDRALNILLRKYRDSQPSATLSTVKKTMKSLQSSYRNELRIALQQARLTGSDCTAYDSPWWCFAELDFLRPQEENRLKKELIKEEDALPITGEDNMISYCMSLAEKMRKLSAEQLKYAKHHFRTILHIASKGLLTRDWPQLHSNKPVKGCGSPTASCRVQQPACVVHTVKGTVRFGKRSAPNSAVNAQNSKKRLMRAIVDEIIDLPLEEAKECEPLFTKYKDEPSDAEIAETEEDMVIDDTEEAKLGNNLVDDETSTLVHQQSKDIDANLENLEITFVELQDVPEGSDHPVFGLLATTGDTSNESNLISVRLPSGSTLRRQCRMHSSNYVDNAVTNYSDEEFLRQFRMGRDTVQMLSQHLETTNAYKKLKGHGGYEAISAQTHVLAFLWFLGHEKTSYRDVAERFELSVSCLHDVIWRVCDSILEMEADVIVSPDDGQKCISERHFGSLYSIPNVIGCVGGTQIKIDKPIENADRYLLRKGYYSMQLQAITDEHLHFVDVFVEYPGEPDMLAAVKQLCADRYCLLGGDEYPCLPQLLVPYRTDGGIPLTKAQQSFNDRLQMARNSCAHVFQQLKQRFRQLYHLKGRQLPRVVKLIKVCCILHNLASESEMALIESEANDHREEEPCASVPVFTYSSEDQSASEVALGREHRDTICANF